MPHSALQTSLWETVKCDFKSLFPEDVFQMWFEPVVCLETTMDSMALGVPNDFAAFFKAHPGIGRICFNGRKINLSQVFAGQCVGIKQVEDRLWLVTFMDYDLGYFDDETCRLESVENPFGPKVLPMSPE